LHFNGGQALYTQYGSNHIQIGDYTFDKYVPETIVGGNDWDKMLSSYFGLNYKDSLTYIIPFFIYQDELYFQWGNGNSTEWKITDGSVSVKVFSYYFNSWFKMLGQRYACSYTSSTDLNGMEFYLTRDLGNFTYSHHSLQVSTSTNHWLNVSEVVRQKPSNYQTITNNVKTFPNIVSNGSVSDVSAFGESGAFGFFYVPPEFYYYSNLTLHDYILTLTAENLYHQPPPLELIMTVKLPDKLTAILDELGDDDTVTIVRDPDTGDITYNITVNNYHNITFDDSRILGRLDTIIFELKSGFNRVIEAIGDVSLKITNFYYDDSYHEATPEKIPWWQRLIDSVGTSIGNVTSGVGDMLGGAGGLLAGIGEMFNPLFEFIENMTDKLIELFVPSEGFINLHINEIYDIFKDEVSFFKDVRDFLYEFFGTLERGPCAIHSATPLEGDEQLSPKPPLYDGTSISERTGFDFVTIDGEDVPVFKISVYGTVVNAIDFSYVHDYRKMIHALIIGFAWVLFFRNLLKKAPSYFVLPGGD